MDSSMFIMAREGKARLLIPNPDLYKRRDGVYEPSWAPVFYNPRMKFNRDLSVTALSAYHRLYSPKPSVRGVDLLSGTGVRAIRYALESSGVEKFYANDKNPRAYRIIADNIRLNNLGDRVTPLNYEANYAALYIKDELEEPILYIDIDPYGSPIPFIDNALRLVGHRGVIGFTATDIAPLVGSRVKAGLRRYGSVTGKTPFSRELAVRILLGVIARYAGVHEKSVRPLLVFYHEYYIRGFVLVERGAGKADRSMNMLGCIGYSKPTGYTAYTDDITCSSPLTDPYTGSRLTILGPLWKGELGDKEFIEATLLIEEESVHHETRREVSRLLSRLAVEYEIDNRPPYRLDHCARLMGGVMPRPSKVIESLRGKGYRAVVSYLDPQSIRTDAPIREIYDSCLESIRK